MFATIMRSNTPDGDRQTVIIPLQDKVRVFTRVGSGRGIAGAWKEELPTVSGEKVIGKPTAITMTANDYRDLQFPITPTTLLQKLLRTVDSDVVTDRDALEEFSEIYGKAKANPISLATYLKGASAMETPIVSPTVVESIQEEPVSEQVSTPVVEQDSREDSMATQFMATTEPANPSETVLTIPEVTPYFSRKFSSLTEQEIYDYARNTQQNVLLTGEAGTGKTSSARNYAAVNSLPFITIECTQQIDQGVTQGRFVPTGLGNATRWMYSQLATAIQQPSVVLLNELTRMTPKAASLFLRLLAERELLIEPLNEVIKVHPECLIIADQNTGFGYTGTSKQDTALVDRFNIKLEFKYDTAIESKFIKSASLLEFASNIRQASELNDEFSIPMSTRVLQNFQAQATSLNFEFAVNAMLANYPKSDGEREAIKMRLDAEIDRIASELGVPLGGYNK